VISTVFNSLTDFPLFVACAGGFEMDPGLYKDPFKDAKIVHHEALSRKYSKPLKSRNLYDHSTKSG
jgi:hypothetical protein